MQSIRLDWLSHNWPGIPYPYEKTTVFQGYAGMEYPMMANDETYSDTCFRALLPNMKLHIHTCPFIWVLMKRVMALWMKAGQQHMNT